MLVIMRAMLANGTDYHDEPAPKRQGSVAWKPTHHLPRWSGRLAAPTEEARTPATGPTGRYPQPIRDWPSQPV